MILLWYMNYVATGFGHVCIISDSSQLYCWGSNFNGELGDGTQTASYTPKLIADQIKFVDIAASQGITCGITNIGTAYCWGESNKGALGDGHSKQSNVPVLVQAPEVKFSKLHVYNSGNGHSLDGSVCATTSLGKAYCWGDNHLGELGNGTKNNSSSPVEVKF